MFVSTLTGTLLTLWSHNEFGKGNNPRRKNHNVTNFRALRGWALLYYPVVEPLAMWLLSTSCGYWALQMWRVQTETVGVKHKLDFEDFVWKKREENLILRCWLHVVKVAQLCLTLCDPHGLYSPWNSPGLLQGIFPIQGSNPGLLHCRRILYQLSHKGSPRILEWVAYPFASGSSQPKNWTGRTAGGFFTNWAMLRYF